MHLCTVLKIFNFEIFEEFSKNTNAFFSVLFFRKVQTITSNFAEDTILIGPAVSEIQIKKNAFKKKLRFIRAEECGVSYISK